MDDDAPALPVAADQVVALVHVVRGQKVLLDSDLAALYGVATRIVTRAVTRHPERFPDDFMFQLSEDEYGALRSQIGISNSRGGRRYLPYVFTEQGVAMLSSFLNSPRAVAVNVEIMRAFVRMRSALASHAELAQRLDVLEARYDDQFAAVFAAIRELMAPPPAPGRQLGFVPAGGRA
jgi:hypothetical protein